MKNLFEIRVDLGNLAKILGRIEAKLDRIWPEQAPAAPPAPKKVRVLRVDDAERYKVALKDAIERGLDAETLAIMPRE